LCLASKLNSNNTLFVIKSVTMSMDDFTSISLLSLAMLVGCYVAGTIPLAVNFSEVSSNSNYETHGLETKNVTFS
jgi:hypothetical protein